MPKKQRRSPEQWQAIITDFESSGLSREAFCESRKLNLDYFGKRLRLATTATPLRSAFVPARVRTEGIGMSNRRLIAEQSAKQFATRIADITDPELIARILDHVQSRAPPSLPPRRAESDTTYPDLFGKRQ